MYIDAEWVRNYISMTKDEGLEMTLHSLQDLQQALETICEVSKRARRHAVPLLTMVNNTISLLHEDPNL